MSLEARDLVRRLQGFGLDGGEATVYFHLSRLGTARAAEVASASKRKRPDTYRLLDSLVRRGFVEKTLERPTRYIAHDLETALERLMETRDKETAALQEERQDLARLWPKPHAEAGPTGQRFTVYQGREQTQGLIQRMLKSASEEVLVAVSPGGLASLGLRPFLQSIHGLAAEGVAIRLLTKPEAHRHEALDDLPDAARIRYAELTSFHQMIIVDAKQIALFVSGGRKLSTQGDQETVLWLNSPDFVLAQKGLFDEVWNTGLAHAEKEAAIAEERLPRETRLLRGRWMRYDRIRRMVGRAQGRIWITASADEVRRWDNAGVPRALSRQAKGGCDVWVWTDGEVPTIDGATVVRLDEAPANEVLVDGREAVSVYGAGDAADAIAHEDEWSLWSTHPDHVGQVEAHMLGLPEARPVVKMH